MTAIIVDDEKHCRDVLELLLHKYCPTVQVVANCEDGPSALRAIELHKPAIVFLDIEMPGMNGFTLLENCQQRSFEVIFTTAYNEYAIKAIRHNALDYIVKPIDKDELLQAVSRVKQHIDLPPAPRIENLIEYLHRQKNGHL
jgi:two-component system LytT family response regulator